MADTATKLPDTIILKSTFSPEEMAKLVEQYNPANDPYTVRPLTPAQVENARQKRTGEFADMPTEPEAFNYALSERALKAITRVIPRPAHL